MSKIIDISTFLPVLAEGARAFPQTRAAEALRRAAAAARCVQDSVELSPRGIALARACRESSDRIAHHAAIADQIAAGTYETPDKIQRTVDLLLDVIV
jgi:hypothetical protein